MRGGGPARLSGLAGPCPGASGQAGLWEQSSPRFRRKAVVCGLPARNPRRPGRRPSLGQDTRQEPGTGAQAARKPAPSLPDRADLCSGLPHTFLPSSLLPPAPGGARCRADPQAAEAGGQGLRALYADLQGRGGSGWAGAPWALGAPGEAQQNQTSTCGGHKKRILCVLTLMHGSALSLPFAFKSSVNVRLGAAATPPTRTSGPAAHTPGALRALQWQGG